MVMSEGITDMSQNQQPPSIPPYQGGSLASDECNGKGVYLPPLTMRVVNGLSPSPDKGMAGEGLKEIAYIEAVIRPTESNGDE